MFYNIYKNKLLYMNIHPLNKSLVTLDQNLDYIPVISTITNLVNICIKCTQNFFCANYSLRNHYLSHIKDKSLFQCVILLIPIFGNIAYHTLRSRIQPQLPKNPLSHGRAISQVDLKSGSSSTVPSIETFKQMVVGKAPKIAPNQSVLESKLPHMSVTFANLSGLTLSRENFGEIFRRINEATLNKPYPNREWDTFDGEKVGRPNHNGTHAARQAKMFQLLVDWLKDVGSDETKKNLSFSEENEDEAEKDLTKEMIDFLTLGVFLIRSGRIDETSFKHRKADLLNKTRSAQIFSIYSEYLEFPSNTIDMPTKLQKTSWIESLLRNATVPEKACEPKFFDQNKKNNTFYHLISMVHKLDLIRCYSSKSEENLKDEIKTHLFILLGKTDDLDKKVDRLFSLSKALCKATGSQQLMYHAKVDEKLFASCSIDGAFCWQKLTQSEAVKKAYSVLVQNHPL